MISDFVKGRKKFDFPEGVQKGIALHRLIDDFTDDHDATREGKEIFRPHYRLYSGAVMDVIYDHFLANDPGVFENGHLEAFARETYTALELQADLMPDRFALMFPYMKNQNWLVNYQSREGILQSLGGLVRRSAYLTDNRPAFALFEEHYQPLSGCYRQLWADLLPYVRKHFNELFHHAL